MAHPVPTRVSNCMSYLIICRHSCQIVVKVSALVKLAAQTILMRDIVQKIYNPNKHAL